MVVMMLYQQCESYCCAIYEFSNSYNLHYVETLLSVNCTSGKLTSHAFALGNLHNFNVWVLRVQGDD